MLCIFPNKSNNYRKWPKSQPPTGQNSVLYSYRVTESPPLKGGAAGIPVSVTRQSSLGDPLLPGGRGSVPTPHACSQVCHSLSVSYADSIHAWSPWALRSVRCRHRFVVPFACWCCNFPPGSVSTSDRCNHFLASISRRHMLLADPNPGQSRLPAFSVPTLVQGTWRKVTTITSIRLT